MEQLCLKKTWHLMRSYFDHLTALCAWYCLSTAPSMNSLSLREDEDDHIRFVQTGKLRNGDETEATQPIVNRGRLKPKHLGCRVPPTALLAVLCPVEDMPGIGLG